MASAKRSSGSDAHRPAGDGSRQRVGRLRRGASPIRVEEWDRSASPRASPAASAGRWRPRSPCRLRRHWATPAPTGKEKQTDCHALCRTGLRRNPNRREPRRRHGPRPRAAPVIPPAPSARAQAGTAAVRPHGNHAPAQSMRSTRSRTIVPAPAGAVSSAVPLPASAAFRVHTRHRSQVTLSILPWPTGSSTTSHRCWPSPRPAGHARTPSTSSTAPWCPPATATIASSGKNCRYLTNLQVVIDADSRPVVAIGIPPPGSRDGCRTFAESGVDRSCRGAPTVTGGGHQGTGLLTPHREPRGQIRLGPEQEAENAVPHRARARGEHVLSRLKNWKILRDHRLKGNGVHQAMLNTARLHSLALTG